ncbi:beta-mannosidase [Microlunatus sagamiharensis]|uniref:beta-mannosidase n=1 Tax=Microlunatus sagamiharensis TaxID=546874 RepID=A0A1H2M1G6_9ACTN|nr:glycoside hydrolase family 2 protein [Microlunatus sagamiharensis]SDU86366.1 beta-mannosidase [Microlunatus sagamiharensis]
MRRLLDQGWTVRATDGPVPPELAGALSDGIPATVPGCVHTDLLFAGLVPDPFLDQNEALLAWVGETGWRYAIALSWTEDDQARGDAVVELVAEGLDTVATVELDGRVVARTANMHRTHRVDLTDVITVGDHELAVSFEAPVPAAQRASEALGPRPCAYEQPFNALRKMACSYGWDWGPTLATSGIWKPLTLRGWSTARLGGVRPLVDVQSEDGTERGVLDVHVEVVRAPGDVSALTVSAQVAGRSAEVEVPAGSTSAVVHLEVDDVAVWWPVGYGDQPLHPVAVSLATGERALDSWEGEVGFRTVALDTTPDADGTPFRLVVNGTPVFARGLNWIPDDVFPSRMTPERYADRLGEAVAVGANLVRVWGGGLYESDDFYAACDRLGLMVWQDFLFACAAYAEEEPLRSEVEAEAREAVTRLSAHPSLVLWNGNNENIWGHEDWGWKDDLDGRTWGLGYYTDLLPGIVAELDPTRPYCPGTPYAMSPDLHPNDPHHGPSHLWDVWNVLDYAHYRDSVPRFVAEFGWQGPPAWSTLTRAVHDDPLTPTSPGMAAHQKAADGDLKLSRGLAPHLPVPEGVDDWHWATSLNQARALTFGIEHLRSWSPVCSGAVWWQLNDLWPVTSWAVVDGEGRRKPVWYALRRAFADRLVTVQPRAEGLAVVVVNDGPKDWADVVRVRRLRHDGTVVGEQALPLAVAARTTATLALDPATSEPGDPAGEVLLAEVGGLRAWWWFVEDRDGALAAADLGSALEAGVEPVEGGYAVRVTARTLVKDLAVLADRVDPEAQADDMLVSLLPGESVTVHVSGPAGLAAEDLLGPLVLRSANQLLHAVAGGAIRGSAAAS